MTLDSIVYMAVFVVVTESDDAGCLQAVLESTIALSGRRVM